jgi:biopolymer transport protein ExbB
VDFLVQFYEAFTIFMEKGGPILYWIMLVTFLMWVFIIERLWYLRFIFKADQRRIQLIWETREERKSWYALKIRASLISRASERLHQGLNIIKTLVALCPLIGLLGTVTGMIQVFEVMAILGSGNARAMADGVSKATIPTMAGMVAALSGVFVATYLERMINRGSHSLEDALVMDH